VPSGEGGKEMEKPKEGEKPMGGEKPPEGGTTKPSTVGSLASPATLVVNLPEDARLLVEGQPTRATSSTRRFISPPLPSGKTFVYQLQAQVTREGKTLTTNRVVQVRAGQQTQVTLSFPSQVARK
jgi:uncharacterized protein (TIGR03000 family)